MGDRALGAFLRSRRERLSPQEVGLSGSGQRRTPGLRREEVAHLAGVSVEWYTRLEQGRGGSPSAHVLNSLATALRLKPVEREHLRSLASAPERHTPDDDPTDLTQLQQVLDAFASGPAYLKTAAWDIVAWNEAARVVLTDYPSIPARRRNALRLLFLDPSARTHIVDWPEEARLAVATFRLELLRRGSTPSTDALIGELSAASSEFAALWDGQDVGYLGEGVKLLDHPRCGRLAMRYSSYAVDNRPGLGLVLYTPASHADAVAIQRLVDGMPLPLDGSPRYPPSREED